MPDELVHLRVDHGVATITLDSQHNRNALSRQLRRELAAHLTTAKTADDVRVIVLTHTSTVFCAGADLTEARDGDAAAEAATVALPDILTTLMTGPTPVVARVGGAARAGGIGLIAACDIALASASATFALTEVRIGVVAAVISVPLLPRLVPRAAQELFRSGAPTAMAATRRLLSATTGDEGELRARFAAMDALSRQHFASAEAAEGIAAFRQKRPPPPGFPAHADITAGVPAPGEGGRCERPALEILCAASSLPTGQACAQTERRCVPSYGDIHRGAPRMSENGTPIRRIANPALRDRVGEGWFLPRA